MFVSSITYAGVTQRVSILNNGNQSDFGWSASPSMSADGRFVAFESCSDNLVSNDTNESLDVFVRDMQTGEIQRVSVSDDGMQLDSASYAPSISADGRYVAFTTTTYDQVSYDVLTSECFVRDLQTNKTECVSISSDGGQANGYSDSPSISANGRYVAFTSTAENLVPDDTNGFQDVFVRDMQTGKTKLVSVSSEGVQANTCCWEPSISADGKFVVFTSGADNLVSNDTNLSEDVFIYNMQTGETQRISISTDGVETNYESWDPSISADGRFVAFESFADNLVNGSENINRGLFVRDTQTGITECVNIEKDGSQAYCYSYTSHISADGRFVTFASYADNLVTGDDNETIDIFVRDRQTGETRLASVTSEGLQADYGSLNACISADGRFVAFESWASNLVPDDSNEVRNVYIHDMEGVSLSKTNMLIKKGSSEKLAADVHLFGTANNDVIWSSSNTDVATVNANGTVTAISEGTATITATTVDKSLTADCSIIVKSMIYFTSPTIKDYCDTYSKKISISGKIDSSLTKASWQIDSKHKGSCKIRNGSWSAGKIELALGENLITVHRNNERKTGLYQHTACKLCR